MVNPTSRGSLAFFVFKYTVLSVLILHISGVFVHESAHLLQYRYLGMSTDEYCLYGHRSTPEMEAIGWVESYGMGLSKSQRDGLEDQAYAVQAVYYVAFPGIVVFLIERESQEAKKALIQRSNELENARLERLKASPP